MNSKLATSGAWLSVLSFAQLLIGLLARSVYAGIFGTSREMDVFLLVMGVVTWFTGIVAVAANKGLVPSFIEVREQRGEHEAWRMASTVINGLWLISLAVIGLGWLLADRVASFIGAGLEPRARLLAAGLFRLAVPIIAANLLTGIFTALLFSYSDFIVPKSLRLVGLVAAIGAVVVLSPHIGIYSMAVGMLLDGLITCGVLSLRIRWKGLPYSPSCLDWRSGEVFRFVQVTLPLMAAALFSRAQNLVDRFFASFLVVGSISFLNYANSLVNVPKAMLVAGMEVVLPHFSGLAARDNLAEFRRDVERGLSFALFLAMPAYAGSLCLGKPTIVALFQHGQFDAVSAENTWAVIPLYFGPLLIGIPGIIISSALYSLKETKIVFGIGILTLVNNAVFDYLFIKMFGYPGIALSSSIVFLPNFVLTLHFLQKRIGNLRLSTALLSLMRTLFACAGMAATLLFLQQELPVLASERVELINLVKLAAQVGIGALVYGGCAYIVGSQEVRYVLRWARKGGMEALTRLRLLYGSVFSRPA